MIRIILEGVRKKLTANSVQYTTAKGSFYVKKSDLKASGCTVAPENLFFIVTDELPEGLEATAEEQLQINFEL